MDRECQKILLNDVRQRILHFILRHGSVTVREIGDHLCDVPQASLYRQMKILSDSGMIRVQDEKQVRGTLEHTYALDPGLLPGSSAEDDGLRTQFTLLSLAQDFSDYYANDADPNADMLELSSNALFMTDDEFKEYLSEMKRITEKYLSAVPDSGRRRRRVTLISSPA